MQLHRAGKRLGAVYWLLTLLAAGCGADSQAPRRSAAAACPPPPAQRVSGVVTCVHGADGGRVRVTVDSAPQAWRRWNASQVERTQAAVEWSHTPSQAPHDVPHVGAGAFWVTGPRMLVATDGRRLVTIKVIRTASGVPARDLAVRVAASALGPPRVPVYTGP